MFLNWIHTIYPFVASCLWNVVTSSYNSLFSLKLYYTQFTHPSPEQIILCVASNRGIVLTLWKSKATTPFNQICSSEKEKRHKNTIDVLTMDAQWLPPLLSIIYTTRFKTWLRLVACMDNRVCLDAQYVCISHTEPCQPRWIAVISKYWVNFKGTSSIAWGSSVSDYYPWQQPYLVRFFIVGTAFTVVQVQLS